MRKLLVVLQLLAFSIAAWWMHNPCGSNLGQQLVIAAQSHDVARLRQALASGGSVEARDYWGMTALMWAACDGEAALVRDLLEAGAAVSARSDIDQTALCYAAMRNEAGVVRILLAAGAQVDERGHRQGTALHNAVAMCSLDVAQVLVAHGADVNARDCSGQTPLMVAAARNENSEGMIELLIESGADLYALDDEANTALDCANDANAADVARILRNAAARIQPERERTLITAPSFGASETPCRTTAE